MKRRTRGAIVTLMATTSIVALSLTVAPVVLDPDLGGASVAYAKSCFVAGTRVLMADGSLRPIEALRPGDLVRGGRGGVNRVVEVERPKLAGRRLYAFNGGVPFVTAEHPFLTLAGWKAIDPAATAWENAALKVAVLRPGDLLTCARQAVLPAVAGNLARECEIELWLEPLRELTAVEADPETVVYNLLLDGDHSYVANGFVVHNKDGDDGSGGGDDGGGDDGGGESGGGGEGGGDDDRGGDDDSGDDGGGEGGESGDDDSGESGESGESGSSGESGESGDSGESGERGDGFFPGDPGEADRDLTPSEEEALIERGWQ